MQKCIFDPLKRDSFATSLLKIFQQTKVCIYWENSDMEARMFDISKINIVVTL